jgi:UDP-N-acetylglucosamine--N-acetylmuramyl-(pentapeptide) pyrophosphoryl-undecaprenol N-acetylglucosamine transferase
VKVAILAGGTGGHVYPALAVAQVLRARGHEVFWIGTPDSFESRVVPAQKIPMEFVRVSGLRGKGVLKLLTAPLQLLRAVWQALRIFRRQRPAAVLGMGGYAAGPGGIAAWLTRTPLLIHESNAAAGLTNRALAHFSRAALQAFPQTFPGGVTVGNPVRADIAALPAPAQRLAGRSGKLRVLVIGGSQGARALNERVPQALARMPEGERPEVRHQAGRTLDIARNAYAQARVAGLVEQFIEDMAAAYAWADLVICRSGASTVAELAAAGCAAILVPFPAAVDDHQTRNAEHLVRAGAALLIPEAQLTPDALSARLAELSANRARVLAMSNAARGVAWQGAEAKIADALLEAGRE